MHTVIVGGGFAGVKAALELSKKQLGKITLISQEPHFLHHATLYATATGRNPQESVIALEDIFAHHHDVEIVQDKVVSLDADRRLIVGEAQQYHYDTLILALGMTTSFFGIDGMAENSFGIKTLDDVKAFREHLRNELVLDEHLDKNYVIVGGGPTGVELAGALSPYLKELAKKHLTQRAKINIVLVEAADRILPRMSKAASKIVTKRLKDLGVKVKTGQKVKALSDTHITVGGKKVPTHTVVWTSGMTMNPFYQNNSRYFEFAHNGKIVVNPYLQAYDHIYVLGDNADVPESGMAFPAMNTGEYVADHITRKLTGRGQKPYIPQRPVYGIPVGEKWAYVEESGVYITGRLGHYYRRRIELEGLKRLVSPELAKAAWYAHEIKVEL